MRRLRPEDGTRAHRRAARYHRAKCAQGKSPLHVQLRTEITTCLATLRTASRGTEDAEDVLVEANAVADSAELEVEAQIRNLDHELDRLDRDDPSLGARKTVFPHGYGEVIDPEGDEQLKVLGPLKVKLKPFAGLGTVGAIVDQVDLAAIVFQEALTAENIAQDAYEVAFAEEVGARRQIREQLESAYGQLRAFYKARPALAERLFSNEGVSRTAPKEKKGGTPTGGADASGEGSGTP